MLILLGFLLALGFIVFVWLRHQKAQTLEAHLNARLPLLGFELKAYGAFGGYEFTREDLIIREDRIDIRDSLAIEIFCSAPNIEPLKQTFIRNDVKGKIAAITTWLLENKIIDLQKEYSDALYQEYLRSRR